MKKDKSVLQFISFCVTVAFFATSVISPGTVYAIETPTVENAPFSFTLKDILIPEAVGSIQDLYSPEEQTTKVVIEIQDAHGILEAQKNIQELIRIFQDKYSQTLIGLEGGVGRISDVLYRTLPDQKIKEKLVQDYLKQGELSGGEAAMVLNPKPGSFYGVETPGLYLKNYEAYLAAIKARAGTLATLAALKQKLDTVRGQVYSTQLIRFDDNAKAFTEDRLSLLDFAQVLKGEALNLNIQIQSAYPALATLYMAQAKEEEMKTPEMVQVTGRFIREMKPLVEKALTPEELAEFNGKFQQFNTGQMDQVEMLRYLHGQAQEHAVTIERFEEIRDYFLFRENLQKTEGERLFDDIERLTNEVKRHYFRTDQEGELDKLYRNVEIIRKLARLEVLHEDLALFEGRPEEFTPEYFNQFLEKFNERLLVKWELTAPKNFYQYARERDQALFENFMKVLKEQKMTQGIIVTGGFHTEGLKTRFKEAGYAYLVLSPRITKFDTENTYEKIMQEQASFLTPKKSQLATALRSLNDFFEKRYVSGAYGSGADLKKWTDELARKGGPEAARAIELLQQILEAAGKGQRGAEVMQAIQKANDVLDKDILGKIVENFDAFKTNLTRFLNESQGTVTPESIQLLAEGKVDEAIKATGKALGALSPEREAIAQRLAREAAVYLALTKIPGKESDTLKIEPKVDQILRESGVTKLERIFPIIERAKQLVAAVQAQGEAIDQNIQNALNSGKVVSLVDGKGVVRFLEKSNGTIKISTVKSDGTIRPSAGQYLDVQRILRQKPDAFRVDLQSDNAFLAAQARTLAVTGKSLGEAFDKEAFDKFKKYLAEDSKFLDLQKALLGPEALAIFPQTQNFDFKGITIAPLKLPEVNYNYNYIQAKQIDPELINQIKALYQQPTVRERVNLAILKALFDAFCSLMGLIDQQADPASFAQFFWIKGALDQRMSQLPSDLQAEVKPLADEAGKATAKSLGEQKVAEDIWEMAAKESAVAPVLTRRAAVDQIMKFSDQILELLSTVKTQTDMNPNIEKEFGQLQDKLNSRLDEAIGKGFVTQGERENYEREVVNVFNEMQARINKAEDIKVREEFARAKGEALTDIAARADKIVTVLSSATPQTDLADVQTQYDGLSEAIARAQSSRFLTDADAKGFLDKVSAANDSMLRRLAEAEGKAKTEAERQKLESEALFQSLLKRVNSAKDIPTLEALVTEANADIAKLSSNRASELQTALSGRFEIINALSSLEGILAQAKDKPLLEQISILLQADDFAKKFGQENLSAESVNALNVLIDDFENNIKDEISDILAAIAYPDLNNLPEAQKKLGELRAAKANLTGRDNLAGVLDIVYFTANERTSKLGLVNAGDLQIDKLDLLEAGIGLTPEVPFQARSVASRYQGNLNAFFPEISPAVLTQAAATAQKLNIQRAPQTKGQSLGVTAQAIELLKTIEDKSRPGEFPSDTKQRIRKLNDRSFALKALKGYEAGNELPAIYPEDDYIMGPLLKMLDIRLELTSGKAGSAKLDGAINILAAAVSLLESSLPKEAAPLPQIVAKVAQPAVARPQVTADQGVAANNLVSFEAPYFKGRQQAAEKIIVNSQLGINTAEWDKNFPGVSPELIGYLQQGYFLTDAFRSLGRGWQIQMNEGGETIMGTAASVTDAQAKILQEWQKQNSFQPQPGKGLELKKTVENRLKDLGIALRYYRLYGGRVLQDGSPEAIDAYDSGAEALEVISNVLDLLPASFFEGGAIQQLSMNAPRVLAARGSAFEMGEDGQPRSVSMYSWAVNNRRTFTGLLLHEMGHSIDYRLSNDLQSKRKGLVGAWQKLSGANAFLGVEFGVMDAAYRRGYQGDDFGEFIAETNMMYVLSGNLLRKHINSIKDASVRAAYANVYNFFKEIYGGREFSQGAQQQAPMPALALIPGFENLTPEQISKMSPDQIKQQKIDTRYQLTDLLPEVGSGPQAINPQVFKFHLELEKSIGAIAKTDGKQLPSDYYDKFLDVLKEMVEKKQAVEKAKGRKYTNVSAGSLRIAVDRYVKALPDMRAAAMAPALPADFDEQINKLLEDQAILNMAVAGSRGALIERLSPELRPIRTQSASAQAWENITTGQLADAVLQAAATAQKLNIQRAPQTKGQSLGQRQQAVRSERSFGSLTVGGITALATMILLPFMVPALAGPFVVLAYAALVISGPVFLYSLGKGVWEAGKGLYESLKGAQAGRSGVLVGAATKPGKRKAPLTKPVVRGVSLGQRQQAVRSERSFGSLTVGGITALATMILLPFMVPALAGPFVVLAYVALVISGPVFLYSLGKGVWEAGKGLYESWNKVQAAGRRGVLVGAATKPGKRKAPLTKPVVRGVSLGEAIAVDLRLEDALFLTQHDRATKLFGETVFSDKTRLTVQVGRNSFLDIDADGVTPYQRERDAQGNWGPRIYLKGSIDVMVSFPFTADRSFVIARNKMDEKKPTILFNPESFKLKDLAVHSAGHLEITPVTLADKTKGFKLTYLGKEGSPQNGYYIQNFSNSDVGMSAAETRRDPNRAAYNAVKKILEGSVLLQAKMLTPERVERVFEALRDIYQNAEPGSEVRKGAASLLVDLGLTTVKWGATSTKITASNLAWSHPLTNDFRGLIDSIAKDKLSDPLTSTGARKLLDNNELLEQKITDRLRNINHEVQQAQILTGDEARYVSVFAEGKYPGRLREFARLIQQEDARAQAVHDILQLFKMPDMAKIRQKVREQEQFLLRNPARTLTVQNDQKVSAALAIAQKNGLDIAEALADLKKVYLANTDNILARFERSVKQGRGLSSDNQIWLGQLKNKPLVMESEAIRNRIDYLAARVKWLNEITEARNTEIKKLDEAIAASELKTAQTAAAKIHGFDVMTRYLSALESRDEREPYANVNIPGLVYGKKSSFESPDSADEVSVELDMNSVKICIADGAGHGPDGVLAQRLAALSSALTPPKNAGFDESLGYALVRQRNALNGFFVSQGEYTLKPNADKPGTYRVQMKNNGSMNPFFVLREGKVAHSWEEIKKKRPMGAAYGFSDKFPAVTKDLGIELKPGDIVVGFTDGIEEDVADINKIAKNTEEFLTGLFAAPQALERAAPKEIVETLFQGLGQQLKNRTDDWTAFAVQLPELRGAEMSLIGDQVEGAIDYAQNNPNDRYVLAASLETDRNKIAGLLGANLRTLDEFLGQITGKPGVLQEQPNVIRGLFKAPASEMPLRVAAATLPAPKGIETARTTGKALGAEVPSEAIKNLVMNVAGLRTEALTPGEADRIANFINNNRGTPERVIAEFDKALERLKTDIKAQCEQILNNLADGKLTAKTFADLQAVLNEKFGKAATMTDADRTTLEEAFNTIKTAAALTIGTKAATALAENMGIQSLIASNPLAAETSLKKLVSELNNLAKTYGVSSVELKMSLAVLASQIIPSRDMEGFLKTLGLEGAEGEKVSALLSVHFLLSKADKALPDYRALADLIKAVNSKYPGLIQQVAATDKVAKAAQLSVGPVMSDKPQLSLNTAVPEAQALQSKGLPNLTPAVFTNTGVVQVNVYTLTALALAAQISDKVKRDEFLEKTGIFKFEGGIPINLVKEALDKFVTEFKAAQAREKAA